MEAEQGAFPGTLRIPFSGSFEAFCEIGRKAVSEAVPLLEPGKDMPPLSLVHRKQDAAILAMEIPGQWFQSARTKEALGAQVLYPLVLAGADYIAIATMMWAVKSDSPAGREVNRLHDAGEPIPYFPDLGLEGIEERVGVWAMESGHSVMWQATVERSESDPPRLLEWDLVTELESHWNDACQEAWDEREQA